IDILKRLFAQSSHLCADIMLATEERCEAIVSLAETYSRLAKLASQKDRAALVKEFETTQKFFNQAFAASEKQNQQVEDYLINNSFSSQDNYQLPVNSEHLSVNS
ncbi:MAG: chorismate mutase, partial [Cyanobacteria bacterium J06636_27]